jgi:histidyl-tRNA synthetase
VAEERWPLDQVAPALHKPPGAFTHPRAAAVHHSQVLKNFMKYRAVKGMNDILPEEARRFQQVERVFRETVECYGFRELRTPLVEELGLFQKSTGETSEVVQKQMFLLDRQREKLALRPEGTPSSARVYVGQKIHAREPVTKWYYIGPMFRAEQPQRGRYRQFHQAGCELYGDPGPVCDAEMIDMLYRMTLRLGIKNVGVKINTLGGAEARAAHKKRLVEFFEPQRQQLSEHARERLDDNPLRILDSKDPRDQQASQNAPLLLDCLSEEDSIHFDGLAAALRELKTPFEIDPKLVRGLDYYTRTCFEIVSDSGSIGSQSALLGGGRYDALLETLGGPKTSAIGFAAGIERLLLAMEDSSAAEPALCFIAPLSADEHLPCLTLASELRQQGLWVELDTRGNSLKSMLRRANNMNARLALILGKDEVSSATVQVKNLASHDSFVVARQDAVARIRDLMLAAPDENGAA